MVKRTLAVVVFVLLIMTISGVSADSPDDTTADIYRYDGEITFQGIPWGIGKEELLKTLEEKYEIFWNGGWTELPHFEYVLEGNQFVHNFHGI